MTTNFDSIPGTSEMASTNRSQATEMDSLFSGLELSELELQQLADKVYRLLYEESRLDSARNGEILWRT